MHPQLEVILVLAWKRTIHFTSELEAVEIKVALYAVPWILCWVLTHILLAHPIPCWRHSLSHLGMSPR